MSSKLRVLVVDDEPENVRVLERTLRRAYDVMTATSGEDALALLGAHADVAIVLSDYRMPGLNGAELLAATLTTHPATRRVIVTGYADSDNMVDAINAGRIHYLVRKPFERTTIEGVVAELARGYLRERDMLEGAGQLAVTNAELLERERSLSRALAAQRQDLLRAQSEVERVSRDLELLGSRDALTGLYNHRTFQERLRAEIARARRHGGPLSLVYADIDDFASLNNELGYTIGDAVLRRLAEAVSSDDAAVRFRESDVVARYGGEEFAILLPETAKDAATLKVDRLRAALRAIEFPGGRAVGISFGVASFPDDAATPEGLVACAERAMRGSRLGGGPPAATGTAPDVRRPEPIAELAADVQARNDRFSSYHHRLFELIATLRRDRSLACLYVDLSQLRFLERDFGVGQHADILTRAGDVLEELKGDRLRRQDLICRTEDADGYLCFLSAPRDGAGPPDLESIAARIEAVLEEELGRALRPLTRELPRVAVGSSRVLDNPITRPERLVVRLVAESRQAAHILAERALQQNKHLLQELILRERLTAVYQPIVHMGSGDVFGFESLTRGPSDSSLESPVALFGVADQVDLTFELDRACFRNALAGAVGLASDHRLFVNLLPASFYDRNLIEHEAATLLRAAALSPSNLVFEITERLAIENFSSFRQALAVYTAMGFGVAIDDVGTRHSNLETVMALRPHFIKLSDVLTRGVAGSTVKREMVRSLQRIADAIDAVMVAEGIETLDDLEVLHGLGVRYGQGYYLARPGAAFPRMTPAVHALVVALGARVVSGTIETARPSAPTSADPLAGATIGATSAASWRDPDAELGESTRPLVRLTIDAPFLDDEGPTGPGDAPWRPLADELGEGGAPMLAALRPRRSSAAPSLDAPEDEASGGGGAFR